MNGKPTVPEPQYDCLGIEVSYVCNLRCMMCPRTFDGAPQELLPREDFYALEPYFNLFHYVHLAGYGEPLLSPHIVEFVKAVRGSRARPGMTTNGLLLKGKVAKGVLEERIDCINVSIDAGEEGTYEFVRGKGTFHRLLETLHGFKELRERLNPEVFMTWVFIMMKSNYRELPKALEYAMELGFNRIVCKHLESAQTPEGFSEALYDTSYVPPPDPAVIEDLEKVLTECRAKAGGKIDVHVHPYLMAPNKMCLANPVGIIYVDYKGNVSPCCYMSALNTRPYQIISTEDIGLIGNIHDQPLSEILKSQYYHDFCGDWRNGRIPKVCNGCVQLARMGLKP